MGERRTISRLLAAAAVIAALAAFAVASAAADNLCSQAPNGANECAAGKAYGVGQAFEAVSLNSEIMTGAFGVVRCEEAGFEYKLTETKLGAAAKAELLGFGFEECEKVGAVPCAVGFSPLPANVQVAQTGGGNANFFLEPKGAPVVVSFEVNCGVLCTYSVAKAAGLLTGANPATIVFAQNLNGAPAGCGAGKFKGTFTAVNPAPVWATK